MTMEMVEPALARRCDALRQPVVDLALAGIPAATEESALGPLIARIDAVSAILAQGTDGIESERYRRWHEIATTTVAQMREAAEAGDGARSWKLFTDPKTGFYELGQACQGCEGW